MTKLNKFSAVESTQSHTFYLKVWICKLGDLLQDNTIQNIVLCTGREGRSLNCSKGLLLWERILIPCYLLLSLFLWLSSFSCLWTQRKFCIQVSWGRTHQNCIWFSMTHLFMDILQGLCSNQILSGNFRFTWLLKEGL